VVSVLVSRSHHARSPANDLVVQLTSSAHAHDQTAVVIVTGVLTDGHRVVPLQRCSAELIIGQRGDLPPEALRASDIAAFVG
jgi:hypothetical protein